MATIGNIVQKSNFSSGVTFEKSWGDGELVASGSGTSARHVYFTGSVFTFYGYVNNVVLGNSINDYTLQYWNGSAWTTLLSQTIQDTQNLLFEVNIETSDSVTYRHRATSDRTWWRVIVRNTNNYWPSNNTGRLRLYGMNAHITYDTNVKGKLIKGYYLASTGVPYKHSSSTTYDVAPTDAWVSSLFDETTLKGTFIYASLPEYCIMPSNTV